jgi:hypothetical protein
MTGSQVFRKGREMYLQEKQREEMLEAAKPLMAWLKKNCHPHCVANVWQASIELYEGIATNRLKEREPKFCPECEEVIREGQDTCVECAWKLKNL